MFTCCLSVCNRSPLLFYFLSLHKFGHELKKKSRQTPAPLFFFNGGTFAKSVSVWRLDFVHETDSYTNRSDSVCCEGGNEKFSIKYRACVQYVALACHQLDQQNDGTGWQIRVNAVSANVPLDKKVDVISMIRVSRIFSSDVSNRTIWTYTVRSDAEERPAWKHKNVPSWTKNIIKFSSLSAPTKIEELTAGSDEKTQRSRAGNRTQGLANSSRTL